MFERTKDRYTEGFLALQACEALEADRHVASSGFGQWVPEELLEGPEVYSPEDREIEEACERLFARALRGR